MENQMEVKTTTQIFNDCIEVITHSSINEDIEKKWVSVESIINELESLEPIGGSDVDFPLIYELICHLKNYESKDSSLNKDVEVNIK